MRRPTHATVVAYLALFVAVGTGGAFAVSASRDSIKSRHLADNAVKRAHVANDAIGAKQLADLPHGVMLAGPREFNGAFDNQPLTFDSADADFFDPDKGTFRAPHDGLYTVDVFIVWANHNPGGSLAVSLVKLNASGAPEAILKGPWDKIEGGHTSLPSPNVELKEGDVVQVVVTNKGADGRTDSAEMAVLFQSG